MFLPLLLIAQTASLPPADSAQSCLYALHEADAPQSVQASYLMAMEGSYYAMLAAKDSPDASFTQDFSDTASALDPNLHMPADDARQQLARCRTAYPLAQATAKPVLPADPFARDVTCYGALMLAKGVAMGLKMDSDPAYTARVNPIEAAYSARLSDESLTKHGIVSDEQTAALLGKHLKASLRLGNAAAIIDACAAQLPKAG